jgi:hypothetical protein
MRALILAAAMCSAFASPVQAELMLKSNDGSQELRLYESACSHGRTLGHIPEEYRKHFFNARVLDRRGTIQVYGCWAEVEGTVLLVFEDGQFTQFELSKFKESTI